MQDCEVCFVTTSRLSAGLCSLCGRATDAMAQQKPCTLCKACFGQHVVSKVQSSAGLSAVGVQRMQWLWCRSRFHPLQIMLWSACGPGLQIGAGLPAFDKSECQDE